MAKHETLAQAMARFSDEIAEKNSGDNVWNFTAFIMNQFEYAPVSESADNIAETSGVYIGEKRFIMHDGYAEIRIALGSSVDVYRKAFLEK